MSNRDMDSGTEFALQALQGQIKVYTDTVKEKIDDVALQLKEHSKEQREWQIRVEEDLRLAISYGPRIDQLEKQAATYEEIYQKSKGAIWASRVMWAILAVVVSALVWAYVQLGPKVVARTAPPSPPAQVEKK